MERAIGLLHLSLFLAVQRNLNPVINGYIFLFSGSLDMLVRVGGSLINRDYQLDLGGTCGFPLTPNITLVWPPAAPARPHTVVVVG